jgi:hypothetical protein
MVTCFGSAICASAILILVLSILIMLTINLIGVLRLWKQYKIISLVPLILLILGPLAGIPLTRLADYLCQTRFQRHLHQYEQAVVEIESSITSDGYFHTPSGTVFLAYVPPNTYREDDGSLTIEFFVGVFPFPPRHTAYIYRSNNVVEKGSRTAKRWYHTTQVSDRWFRAID